MHLQLVGGVRTCERNSSADPKVVFSVPHSSEGMEVGTEWLLRAPSATRGTPHRHCQGSMFGLSVCQAVVLVWALE